VTSDPLDTPCRHGDSRVTCVPCLNDEIEATVLLAGLEDDVYGMCIHCGAVEVKLVKATGTRDLSGIGESAAYPVGFGCEVCA
jgi:hypothetical protein